MSSITGARQLFHQGITMMENHDQLDAAIVAFQRAGKCLKDILSRPPVAGTLKQAVGGSERTDISAATANTTPKITIAPASSCSVGEQQDDSSFKSPFRFFVGDDHSQQDAQHEQDEGFTEQQLVSCTAALLFNLGLCYQLKGPQTSLVVAARKMYEKAWTCACRSTIPDYSSNCILCLQMAIAMNLSACTFALGELDLSHAWLVTLRAVLDFCYNNSICLSQHCDQHTHDRLVGWMHFFHVATILRTKCIAAGAA